MPKHFSQQFSVSAKEKIQKFFVPGISSNPFSSCGQKILLSISTYEPHAK